MQERAQSRQHAGPAQSADGPAAVTYDLKTLWRLVARQRRPLIVANLVAIAAALASIPTPLILALMVDEVLLDQPGPIVAMLERVSPEAWQGAVWYLVAAFLVTAALRLANTGLTILETRLSARISKSVIFEIRRTLLEHLQRISMAEYETLGSGTVASHLVTDVNAIDEFVSAIISQALVAALTITGTAVILLWLHWQLGLFILLLNPVVIYVTLMFGRRVKKLKKKENRAYQVFQESLAETLSAIRQVRALNREGFYIGRGIQSAREIRRTAFDYHWRSEAANRISFLIFIIGFDLFRLASMLMVLFSDLTIGEMLAVFSYLWFMITPIQTLLDVQYDYHSAAGALERINGVLSKELEPSYPSHQDPFTGKRAVSVSLRGVSFGYGRGEDVIRDLSLDIAAGERVALVGASGSGKTTLVHIILGLYPVRRGHVSFDRVPVEEIGLDIVRENVATVLQDPSLFNESLRMNLTFGRAFSDRQLWRALEVAQLDDIVDELPEGLETVLGKGGVRLSGGQRQRLAIARLILADPKMVILDEATSALDAATEARVHQALTQFLTGRTTIIVAHRLSAVRQASRVLVLEQGRIVEQGHHEELIVSGGHYAALYSDTPRVRRD